MSKKGRITKKVEQKVKEYFAKIENERNPKQCISSLRADSDQPSTDK